MLQEINWKKVIKDFFIFIIKVGLLVLLFYFIFQKYFGFVKESFNIFERYEKIRGISNYAVYVEANLVENAGNNTEVKDILNLYDIETTDFAIYNYIVEGKENFVKIPIISTDTVDNTVEIVYDSIEPDIVIKKDEFVKINLFYEDRLNELTYIYILLLLYIAVCGFLWYLLDIIKYCKLLWKGNV